MKKRKNGYGVLLALTILLTLAALATLIPSSSASKECALGYKALCTFAPMGTVVLLLAAGAPSSSSSPASPSSAAASRPTKTTGTLGFGFDNRAARGIINVSDRYSISFGPIRDRLDKVPPGR